MHSIGKRSFSDSKEVLKTLMKEVNLNAKVQQELLHYAERGESFPYMPRNMIKLENKIKEEEEIPKSVKLPLKPIQRPKSTIEQLGLYEREQFRPNPSKTRPPREKERFQNMMAFGKDIDEELVNEAMNKTSETIDDQPVDLFNEILIEIEERKKFLDDMRVLGMSKRYLPEIQCQISLRIRELEKLDKDRAQELIQEYGL